jgi:hypothetical protein
VERKAHRDASIIRNSRRIGMEQGARETYRSPLSGSRYRGYGNNVPETPLRSRGFQQQRVMGADSPAMNSPGPSFTATPSHMQWSSGFRSHGMNTPANYTTSPYAGGFPGGYTDGTPQSHSGMGTGSPYYYPAPPMAWTPSPYMHQPEYSPYYTPGYVNTPVRGETKGKASGQRDRKNSGETNENESGAGNTGSHAA